MKQIFYNKYFYLAVAAVSLILNSQVVMAVNNGWVENGDNIYFDSGKVGIGTADPTNILSFGNAATRKIWIENSATDVAGKTLTVAGGSTIAGTAVSDVAGGNLILQSGLGTGSGASSIAFQTGTTLASGTTLQTMSTKMTILGNGKVGIGTPGPAGTLDLGSGSAGRSLIWGGTTSGANWYASIGTSYSATALNMLHLLKLDTTSDTTQYSYTGTYAPAGIRIGGANMATGDMFFFTEANGAKTAGETFNTTANTKLIIKNNGNVGIGTTTPDEKLEVSGNLKVNGNIVSDGDICIGTCN